MPNYERGETVGFRYRPENRSRMVSTMGRVVEPFIISFRNSQENIWIVSPIGSRDRIQVPEPDMWKEPPPLQVPAPQNEGVGSESERSDLFQGNCKAGTKDDGGKTLWRYMPWKSLRHVADVLAYGAKKYAPDNWKKVEDGKMRYFDAAMRHLTDWKEDGPFDNGPKGSGLRHLAHAACCCLFALWFEDQEMKQKDEEIKGYGEKQ